MRQLVSTGIILALLGSNIIIGSQYIHDSKEYDKEVKKQRQIINQYKINRRRQYELVKSSGIQIKFLNQMIDQLKQQKNKIQQQKQQLEKKLASINKVKPSLPQPKQQSNQQVFEVTAYTSGVESTGKNPSDKGYGLTASGTYVQQGETVACPSDLPFGTNLYIQDVGYRTCQDRGNAIVSGRLDLYVESLSDAVQFGRRRLTVTILN